MFSKLSLAAYLSNINAVEMVADVATLEPLDAAVEPAAAAVLPAETSPVPFAEEIAASLSKSLKDGSEGRRCYMCEDPDPTENGCLCYEYDPRDQFAWFLPVDEHGECVEGSKPVATDHFEIFNIMATWNAIGTNNGAPRTLSGSSSDIRDSVVVGEGSDELINWSCLCIDPKTGCVSAAKTRLRVLRKNKGPGDIMSPSSTTDDDFDYVENLCFDGLVSVFNAQDYYEQFFGWCNYYHLGKTCEIQKDVCEIKKATKKFMKVKRSKKSKKSKKRSHY